MEKINYEIESMYSELMSSNKDADDKPLATSDFTQIRDKFRQHIQARRNADSDDLVLLDDELINNILALKQETFKLLQNFKNVNTRCMENSTVNTFTSFEEFVGFIMNQKEILESELWKLEAIYNFLEENQLISVSAAGAS